VVTTTGDLARGGRPLLQSLVVALARGRDLQTVRNLLLPLAKSDEKSLASRSVKRGLVILVLIEDSKAFSGGSAHVSWSFNGRLGTAAN